MREPLTQQFLARLLNLLSQTMDATRNLLGTLTYGSLDSLPSILGNNLCVYSPHGFRDVFHYQLSRVGKETQYELLELVVPFLVRRHVNVIADGPQKSLSSHLGETVGEGCHRRNLGQHVCAVAARYLANASLRVDSKVHRKVLSNQTLQRLPDTETEQLSRESKLVEELRFTKVNIEVGLVVQSSHVEVLRCEVLNIIDLRVANNILLRQANEEMVVVAVAAP
ncbi:hypothetical protein BOVATA_018850 [Babesia ovata]|uniref:Uncharacterized protein n=1 Tax=Babesia ovata TaxID=189622 RepID=A0A2H6KBM2_9APIC|nr:uncharacterized protein BOVATA_018850 [Babesia ovata]GBE60392.1 hypothetical protein BOVATA_018850 [Babesia ovata]